MSLYKLSKIIPKRKYVIMNGENRWSMEFMGIYEVEIDGSPITIQNVNEDSDNYKQLLPKEIYTMKDTLLNGMGIHHILYVEPYREYGFDIKLLKNSKWFIAYQRENSIDSILK